MKYCTCTYYDLSGEVVEGEPCSIHPNGCEHGKPWNEPCFECRKNVWGTPAPQDTQPDNQGAKREG